jgi:hypothetical protein
MANNKTKQKKNRKRERIDKRRVKKTGKVKISVLYSRKSKDLSAI